MICDPASDFAALRALFPSLNQTWHNKPAVFFDNPGGTQVPQTVIDAVSEYYRTANANVGGAFPTSNRTDETVWQARQKMADLLNAPDPACIVFGASMTALTFHLARSIGDTIKMGDEIIVTDLDHDANISPWTDLAAQGAIIKFVPVDLDNGATLDLSAFADALTPGKTRLVAVTHASNATGSVPPVAEIIRLAHDAGALVFVDAVQYVPHGPVDVAALNCDFLACSAYKFFGPHVGVLYGKREHLEGFTPHKVRPSKNAIPYRWETGTLNHEGLAGVGAAVDYLAHVGRTCGRSDAAEPAPTDTSGRADTHSGMRAILGWERTLAARLVSGLQALGDITVYGLTDAAHFDKRIPTVAWTWPRLSPRETAEFLGREGIAVWSGNYYAVRLMERLGLEGEGGAVRVGLAHYNTPGEIDRLLDTLASVPRA